MPQPDAGVDQSLRHSMKDAAAFATMMGTGETYFSAFAVFLKASAPQIGLLASLPALLGSFAQLLSAWLGRITGHRKRIVIAGAAIQAGSFLPLALLPVVFRDHAVVLLIAGVVVYQFGAHLATPQWASLMGDVVPARRRGQYFGSRTRVVSLVTFVSLAGGGLLLHWMSEGGRTLAGFLVLFSIAMFSRVVSAVYLSRMHDPGNSVAAMELPIGQEWWRRLSRSNFVRFSAFFALTQFAVAISSPFFAVYMLRDLNFNYAEFMGNTGAAMLAQFLTLTQWGRISDVFGNRRILVLTGTLLPVMPVLWMFSENYVYLLAAQALSGMTWAGFTLGASNFLYDLVAPERRATYLAVHNVLAAFGIFFGAVLGGYLGATLPDEFGAFGWSFAVASPLLGVFAVSAFARLVVVATLLPRIREVRRVRSVALSRVFFRVMRVNVLAGVFFDIIGSRPKRDESDGA